MGIDEERTWTGHGFVEVKEGSVIEFTMIRVPTTGKYSIVIRYDKKVLVLLFNILMGVLR